MCDPFSVQSTASFFLAELSGQSIKSKWEEEKHIMRSFFFFFAFINNTIVCC